MLLLLAGLARGAGSETGLCKTPDALRALTGQAEPTHPHMLEAPPGLGGPGPQMFAADKVPFGTPYVLNRETENFLINWTQADMPEPAVELVAEALELAWTRLIEEQGWPEPVSSQGYLLWVVLDENMEGTGFTTEYIAPEYPQGYPVMYINPTWVTSPAFYKGLAAHEFMHAIQYEMRAYEYDVEAQSWYWEASANMAPELVESSWDGHHYTSAWYADNAHERYDTDIGYHQYGLYVLNAHLEDILGPGTLKSIWEAGRQDPDALWDKLMREGTGLSPEEIFGGFSGRYANGTLPESSFYAFVTPMGLLIEGASSTSSYLGSEFWEVSADTWVKVEGRAVLGNARGESGAEVQVFAGELLSVTGLAQDTQYQLALADEPTPEPEPAPPQAPGGCGCGQVPSSSSFWLMPLLAGALLTRRRKV
ncbi:MAG: hypothetical protein ACI9VR_004807 [Cognaticolwellia sp.]|jgi:hypothetical protein